MQSLKQVSNLYGLVLLNEFLQSLLCILGNWSEINCPGGDDVECPDESGCEDLAPNCLAFTGFSGFRIWLDLKGDEAKWF